MRRYKVFLVSVRGYTVSRSYTLVLDRIHIRDKHTDSQPRSLDYMVANVPKIPA